MTNTAAPDLNALHAAARQRRTEAETAWSAAVAAGDRTAQAAATVEFEAAMAELTEISRAWAKADSARYGDTMPAWATYGS